MPRMSAQWMLDQPTVILAKTVKGWALGGGAEGATSHNTKKLGTKALETFRKRLNLDIPDDQLEFPPTCSSIQRGPRQPTSTSAATHWGAMSLSGPCRDAAHRPRTVSLDRFYKSSGKSRFQQRVPSRACSVLLEDKEIGKRIVPIIPDEGAPLDSTRSLIATASTRRSDSSMNPSTVIPC